MLNRYSFDFGEVVWRNIRGSIRNQGTDSIWYKFLYALFRFLSGPLIDIVNYIYDQIFLEHADFFTLKKIGAELNLYPKQGETEEQFRLRIRTYKNLLKMLLSVTLIKAIFNISLGVEAEIIQGSDYEPFTIGVTPIGTGVSVESMYWKFVWEAILPDLSGKTIDRTSIIEMIENFSIASNEFIIIEDRATGQFTW